MNWILRPHYKHSPSRIDFVYRIENLTMANRAISLRSEFGRYQRTSSKPHQSESICLIPRAIQLARCTFGFE